MATAAFKSTTRRTSIGETNQSSSSTSSSSTSSYSTRLRRSRSVSRFSHRVPAEEEEDPPLPSACRRGKFVNTVRGSGVPEISLDDLAIEMLSSSDFGRFGNSPPSEGIEGPASNRRGRSVSRRGSTVSELRSNGGGNKSGEGGVDGSVRRRRSLSVVSKKSFIVSDSENEHSQKNRSRPDASDLSIWNRQKPSARKPTASDQQRGLRRCSSQKDIFKSYDGYSSYASTLTDDEGNDARHSAHGIEKGMRSAYTQNKGPHASSRDRNNRCYKAMQNEYTHAGKDTRIDTEEVENEHKLSELAGHDGLQSADSDVLKAVSTIRRNYKTKLEESEKRKQELLAEIMLEEKRGKEIKKIVGELLPNPKETSPVKRPMRGRKRSNDRTRPSKQLVEEADRIIEDFISSVEETDMSSFDGERSDTSSVIGGTIKPMLQCGDAEAFRSPLRPDVLPGEMDGVVLPWLKWETGNDGTPHPRYDIKQHPATPKTVLQDALEELACGLEQERSVNSKSSRGSWSPRVVNSFCMDTGETSRTKEHESCKSQLLSQLPRRSRVDIDDYLKSQSNENFLLERWRQRDRIESGGLLLCNGGSLGVFFR